MQHEFPDAQAEPIVPDSTDTATLGQKSLDTPSSHESIVLERTQVVSWLRELHALEISGESVFENRGQSKAIEALRAYAEFHEQAIDSETAENPIEGEFRRLEFSFNLAKIYAEAGFLTESREQIETLLVAALASQDKDVAFGDLYWEMSDYLEAQD